MSIEETMNGVDVVALRMGPPVVLDAATPVHDVLQQMREGQSGCALICHDGKLCGIFTERDVRNKVVGVEGVLDQPISGLMTPDPVCIGETDSIAKAVLAMYRGGFRHVPVLDSEGRVVSCVRHKDIIHFLIEHFAQQVLNRPVHPRYIPKAPHGGS